MFVHKTFILIVAAFFGSGVYASEVSDSPHEMESIGMMQEIVVTAPRYENQDEAWLGMIEGVVVEAERLPTGTEVSIIGMSDADTSPRNNGFAQINDGNICNLLLPLTLTLAIISILYVSVHAYLVAEEVKNERADN